MRRFAESIVPIPDQRMPNASRSRLPGPALLALSLAALAGCGGSNTSPRASAHRRLSPHAQYVAFARAVNLRRQDLVGASVEPREHNGSPYDSTALRDVGKYRHCLKHGKEAKPVFKSSSPRLGSTTVGETPLPNHEEISSEVEVERSATVAHVSFANTLRMLGNPRERRCVGDIFNTLGAHVRSKTLRTRLGYATLRISFGDARVKPVSMHWASRALDDAYAMTISMTVTYSISVRGRTRSFPAPFRLDIFGFRVGRAAVSLSVLDINVHLAGEREETLVPLLISRAQTASSASPAIRIGAPLHRMTAPSRPLVVPRSPERTTPEPGGAGRSV